MVAVTNPINTLRFAEHLRARSVDIDGRRILISRLSGSGQEVDLTAPTNCEGYSRVRHFKQATAAGWPHNPLPIVPACAALGISPALPVMRAQVFQNAACAWRCWYCFVPDELLKADLGRSAWFTADDLVTMYHHVADRPLILDISGGSPDLAPEWTVWMMEALGDQGLQSSTYLWTDDNLSTTYLFDKLDREGIRRLQAFENYGRVCCFKGFDPRSFAFNTRAAESDFNKQFAIMRRLLDLNLDIYGYVTLTSPNSADVGTGVAALVDRLQDLDPLLPLRVIPLKIQLFTPMGPRVANHADRERSLKIQEEAITVWTDELDRRFSAAERNLPIHCVPVGRRGQRT
jgi:uncharacterized Fe-S cluster-containing radical SAM superfamily protein